ncbi:prepilin peptidase [Nitrogeniibacter aestuarii]|uniref:prepilin peptidase n=1 Tax=Nitrogeniibacter aestuarii TaxID=2815343 RepID=UPI001D0F6623|nr:A24 family peptidase [Nitrogeniibacter aestuarii]
MSFLDIEPVVLAAIAGVLGLFVGSFLNVVIHRLPIMLEHEWEDEAADLKGEEPQTRPRFNLATPRSRCPHCGTQVSAIDNVPVLSFLILRGKCRHCSATISHRYPAVEVLTAALSAAAAWHFGPTLATAGALVFIWALIALTFIDLDTQLLPDNITLPLVWLGLLFNLVGTYATLNDAVVGAVAGYMSLWLVFQLFRLVTGKEGMGYGDFKLLAAIGAWLGWQMLPVTILLSSVVGAVVGISLMVFTKHGRDNPIPFGPYLAAAALLALFFGREINTQYLGLL